MGFHMEGGIESSDEPGDLLLESALLEERARPHSLHSHYTPIGSEGHWSH